MIELLCVRHGESEGNVLGLAQGDRPYPLTARGRAQVEDAARVVARHGWRPGRVVTSPVKRCADSAALLAERLGLPEPVPDPAFSEIDSGTGTGRPFRELAAEGLGEGGGGFESLGGESVTDLFRRVGAGLDAQPEGARVLLVTHGAVFKAALVHLTGIPPRFRLDLRPASILRLARTGDGWMLTHFVHAAECG